MAKYKITGPDGASYYVTAPESASEADVMAYASENLGKSAAPKQPAQQTPEGPQVSKTESALRGAGQGLTFNWGDEIYGHAKNLPKLGSVLSTLASAAKDTALGNKADWGAFGRASMDFTGSAEADTAEQRALNKAAKEANPKTYLAGEFGGALAPLAATYAATAVTGGTAAPAAGAQTARVASLFDKIRSGSKVGAGYGAVAGAGDAESEAGADAATRAIDTATGAAKGAAGGAIVGGALPVAGSAVKSTWNAATAPIRSRMDPTGHATRKIAEAVARDEGGNVSPIDAVKNLIARAEEMGQHAPDTRLADAMGTSGKALVDAAASRPNSETNALMKMLDARAKATPQAIEDRMITPHMGDPKQYAATLESVMAKRKAEADKAFPEAFAGTFNPSPKINHLLENTPLLSEGSPIIKNALATANNIQGALGREVTDLEMAHLIKVQLDKAIKWGDNPIAQLGNSGAANIDNGVLKAVRGKFVEALRESKGEGVDKYFKALKAHGEEGGIARAMEAGRNLGKGASPDEIAMSMRNMTAHEQEAFRHGYGAGRSEMNLRGKSTGDRIGRDWESPLVDRQLSEILPADRVAQLGKTKDALAAQAETRRVVQGNSKTNQRREASEDLARDPEMIKAGAQAEMAKKAMNWIERFSKGKLETVIDAVAAGANRVAIPEGSAAQILRSLSMPAESAGASDLVPALVRQAMKQKQDQARHEAIIRMLTRGGAVMSGNK